MVSRSDHRQATLRRLGDAALAQFEENGVGVSIGQIAEAAGVTRRTVHRYVGSKEQLLFIHQSQWLEVFETALFSAPNGPTVDRIRFASRAIASYVDSDPEPLRRSMALVEVHPELMVGGFAAMGFWVQRVAEEVIGNDAKPANKATRFRARVIGAAVMGMVDAVMREWYKEGPNASFVDLYDEGFSLVEPLFSQ